MFTGTCFRHAENTIYFFLTYRNTSSCMAYAITKAGVRWFLDSYPMPMPLNLMALCFQMSICLQKFQNPFPKSSDVNGWCSLPVAVSWM